MCVCVCMCTDLVHDDNLSTMLSTVILCKKKKKNSIFLSLCHLGVFASLSGAKPGIILQTSGSIKATAGSMLWYIHAFGQSWDSAAADRRQKASHDAALKHSSGSACRLSFLWPTAPLLFPFTSCQYSLN